MSAGPTRYRPCALCKGDGCAGCEGQGFYEVTDPTPVHSRPLARVGRLDPHGSYRVAVAQDGWAKSSDGWLYRRWVVVASTDGRTSAARYANGGPVALVRSTAAKVAPDWMLAFVASVPAPMPLAELTALAEAWKKHRCRPPVNKS